jgi:transposase
VGHAPQPWGLERQADQCDALAAALHAQERAGVALKMALRAVYANAAAHNDQEQASRELKAWLSWARRSRLEPFKKLAKTLRSDSTRSCAACWITAATPMWRP